MRFSEWGNYDDCVSGLSNWVYDDNVYFGTEPQQKRYWMDQNDFNWGIGKIKYYQFKVKVIFSVTFVYLLCIFLVINVDICIL